MSSSCAPKTGIVRLTVAKSYAMMSTKFRTKDVSQVDILKAYNRRCYMTTKEVLLHTLHLARDNPKLLLGVRMHEQRELMLYKKRAYNKKYNKRAGLAGLAGAPRISVQTYRMPKPWNALKWTARGRLFLPSMFASSRCCS
jgi:hypothetical protein